MYEVLDDVLHVETWHTMHPLDVERFFRALDRIVKQPNFNPDDMGAYIRAKVSDPALDYAVARLVSDAAVVRDYLKAIGAIGPL
jgi:hypothetical protein